MMLKSCPFRIPGNSLVESWVLVMWPSLWSFPACVIIACSRLILYISWQRPIINHFSTRNWFLHVEMAFRDHIWPQELEPSVLTTARDCLTPQFSAGMWRLIKPLDILLSNRKCPSKGLTIICKMSEWVNEGRNEWNTFCARLWSLPNKKYIYNMAHLRGRLSEPFKSLPVFQRILKLLWTTQLLFPPSLLPPSDLPTSLAFLISLSHSGSTPDFVSLLVVNSQDSPFSRLCCHPRLLGKTPQERKREVANALDWKSRHK